MNSLITLLFERMPILGHLNGYKRMLSRGVLALGAVLPVVQAYYPALPYVNDISAYTLLVSGWLGLEVGNKHAQIKAEKH